MSWQIILGIEAFYSICNALIQGSSKKVLKWAFTVIHTIGWNRSWKVLKWAYFVLFAHLPTGVLKGTHFGILPIGVVDEGLDRNWICFVSDRSDHLCIGIVNCLERNLFWSFYTHSGQCQTGVLKWVIPGFSSSAGLRIAPVCCPCSPIYVFDRLLVWMVSMLDTVLA